jgi:hypothetical protein
MTPEFLQGLAPDAIEALRTANERIQSTPDDMTRIGKVCAYETNESGWVVPVLLYENGERETLPRWETPLPLIGPLVRYGRVYRDEVAEVVYGQLAPG